MSRLTIWGVEGIGEISANDQLGEVIADTPKNISPEIATKIEKIRAKISGIIAKI